MISLPAIDALFIEAHPGILADRSNDMPGSMRPIINAENISRLLAPFWQIANGQDHADLEEPYWGVSAAIRSLLEQKALGLNCPVCNTRQNSTESYPTFSWLGAVLFRFRCCFEYYLIMGFQPFQPIGLYLPSSGLAGAKKLVLSFLDYRIPQLRSDQHAARFEQLFQQFFALVATCPATVMKYRDHGGRHLALLYGFHDNMGHLVREEAPCVVKILRHDRSLIDEYIVGPHNYFKITELLPPKPTLNFSTLAPAKIEEGFRHCLENGLIPFRLTCNQHASQLFSQAVLERLRESCGAACRASREWIKSFSPVLWVTLRTTMRVWLSQASGLSSILTSLHASFPGLAVVFDGLPDTRNVFQQIRAQVNPQLPILDCIGYSREDALALFEACDAYLMPCSNSSAFSFLAPKPGVLHGPEYWFDTGKITLLPGLEKIPTMYVAGARAHGGHTHNHDYEADWRLILDYLRKIIAELRR